MSERTLLVYGLAAGETERWREELLCSAARTEEEVEAVKAAAGRDGWHSFRVAEHTEGARPDFARAVNI